MTDKFEFNSLLVPIDFSPMSREAFDQAMKLATGEDATVIVLHVIDASLAEFAAQHEFGCKDEVVRQMRKRAEKEMAFFAAEPGSPVTVKTMITEGRPFLDIIEKARDFLVDAVVIGKVGVRDELEKLLFGSTAEKVIRGCPRPVLVLPVDDE